MTSFLQDAKLAARSLAIRPFLSGLIVAMLALGIAGNTAVFSVVDALLLRPLPFPEPERLVYLDETAPHWGLEFVYITYPDFFAWRRENQTFQGMAVFDTGAFNLSGDGEPERVAAAWVSHDLAEVLGIQPILGRGFTAEEDRPGGAKAVMLGYGLWQRRFGGDADVVGRAISMAGPTIEHSGTYTVVGVLPPDLAFPRDAELWVPLAADSTERGNYHLAGVGRLGKGISPARARADLRSIQEGLIASGEAPEEVLPIVGSLRERYLGDSKTVATALMGAVGCVLLIACANVAGLMLARFAERGKEIGIRSALGAGRWRLVRQLLTESLVLALLGGLLGTLLGLWGLRALAAVLPAELPFWVRLEPDVRVLGFCLALCLGTTVLFGLTPAWRASRPRIQQVLRREAGGVSSAGGRRRILNGLVVAEIGLALVLVVGAGLLMQALGAVVRVDPGFRAENVLSFRLSLPPLKYGDDAAQIRFFDELLRRLEALPGAASAAAVKNPPLGGHSGYFFEVRGAPAPDPDAPSPVVVQRIVTPEYFRTMGITLLSGRGFSAGEDRASSPPVAIVNETFVRQFLGDSDPVGQRIRYKGWENPWMTVIGVNRDVKHYGLDTEMRPGIHIPQAQDPASVLAVVVRGTLDPAELVAPVRAVVGDLDAELPIYEIRMLAQDLDLSLRPRRVATWTFGLFAAVALVLAIGGIYGVVSYAVTQRTREIGIRMALGARSPQVLRRILGHGLGLATAGVGLGLGGAWGLTRVLSGLLFGISPTDPWILGGGILLLLGVALLANLLPARRAARIEPMRALRYE